MVLAGGGVTAVDDTACQFRRKPRPLLDASVWKVIRNRFDMVYTGFGISGPQNFPSCMDVLASCSYITQHNKNSNGQVTACVARVLTGTRKFDRGLGQVLHDELHWLDVRDRVFSTWQ